MPLRLTALPPGEFIRQHMVALGGMDYVGGIYRSYKAHLRAAGIRGIASRMAMSKYIWICNKMGLIVFDHAEASGRWDGMIEPIAGYVRESRPQAPSPRHYYRIVNPEDPRWHYLEGSYREFLGLPKPVRKPPVRPIVVPIPPPLIEVPTPAPRKRRRPAPPPVPRPPAVKAPAPRRRPAAPDISIYEQRYEDIRNQAIALVARPTVEAIASFKERLNSLLVEVENVSPKFRGAPGERLGEIERHLTSAMEDLDTLWRSVETLARATLPRPKAAAERGVAAAGRVLLENLPPSPVAVAVEKTEEEKERELLSNLVDDLQDILDVSKKTDSLERFEKVLSKLTPEQVEAIEGLDEVNVAIADYKSIPQKGKTPEEYQDEKGSAWTEIENAVAALSGS